MPEHTELIEILRGLGGQSAFIRGTRVRVSDVARHYALCENDDAPARIARALPHLTSAQIRAAIDYWRSHETEIDDEIAEEQSILETFSSQP